MESYLKLLLILAIISFADQAHSQAVTASENPIPVGSNVTLSSNTTVSSGIWLFNREMVVFITPMRGTVLDPWKDRAVFNVNTSSLEIRSLTVKDSGVYTLQDLTTFRAALTLSVQVPVANVTLKANATNLVEYNDTAVLTCSVSAGTSLSYEFLNGNKNITADGEVKYGDKTATFRMKANRHYQGPFRCNVSNGISDGISNPVHLNVSYGPSNVTLTVTPMMSTYKAGVNITLSCSAESSPSASVQWLHNGMSLNHYGSHLKLENVTEAQSGSYKCQFHNSVTLRSSSASAMIWILDPITSVEVTPSGPAILHHPVTLHCKTEGTVDRIYWKKDGYPISADNTTFFGMDNKTLTLNPVQHSDSGHYECQAFNYQSNKTSKPYPLVVYYGPMKPVITGPHMAKTGDTVTLSCNASSKPSSSYEWSHNNKHLSNMSDYVTPPLTSNMSGKYFCTAFNHITGKNSTAYKKLTVIDPIKHVHVEGQMSPPMSGHPYTLTCNVTGPEDHIYWMKGGKPLHEDNSTVFSMDNKTVTFMQLDRNDTGEYRCKAINAVGNMTSPPYMLLVNYGPETPTIEGPAYAKMGHHAVFTCFAMSEPPSTYSWWYKNMSVSNSSVLKTSVLSLNMSGEYTCKAYNNVTMKTSKSSKMLTVIEAIKSVTIHSSSVPIQNKTFALTCVVVGPYDSIYWMKDNMTLHGSMMHGSMMHGSMMHGSMMNSSMMNSSMWNSSMMSSSMWNGSMMNGSMWNGSMMNGSMWNGSMMNGSMWNGSMMNGSMWNSSMMNGSMWNGSSTNHMSYHIKNNTLYFTPVTTHNDGVYRCVATNKVSHLKSPEYKLLTNYGPWSVTISGPQWTNMGLKVSLTCSADSRPESEFQWFFNNHSTPLNNGSVTSFPVTRDTLGEYICEARNPVTNITMYQSKMLAFAGQDSTVYFASRSGLMMVVVVALSAPVLFI